MKETSLSFTHGSPTLLFSWCFTVRSLCFYIQTNQFLLHTPTQSALIINLPNYFPPSLQHCPCDCVYTLRVYFCFLSVSVFVRLLVYSLSPRERSLSGVTFPEGGLCWLRHQGGECRWWGQGNRGAFPVEMGLSLHQLLLQLQQEACRSLGTRLIGTQMGICEEMHTCTPTK